MSALNRKIKKISAFDVFNILLMTTICFITLYPIWYCIVYSFNDGLDAMRGGIYWWPRKISFESYIAVFRDLTILNAFGVSVARTLLATTVRVFFTAMVAYSVSKKYLIGRSIYLLMGTITLFFSGGMIPYYLLIRNLGLIDNFLVYIFPKMFGFFDLLIFMSFFRTLPESLEESARIDGASNMYIFVKIILPLSTAVLIVIALFNGVWNWNDYFVGVIFLSRRADLQPIQTYLYKVIAQTSGNKMLIEAGVSINRRTTSQSVKMATMVVTTLPIVMVYPFLQKHFVKGMLIGSIKG